MRRALSYVVSVTLASCALGQAQAQQALLRMERVQMGEAVCVLVRDDGTYRLEKLYRAKTEMYGGTVEAQRLDQLRLLLRDDRLRKLSEGDIPRRLMTDTVDSVELSIWRDRGWQNLNFFSPADRRPFRESIDPLLKWFQDVEKKRPAATILRGTPTRCLPDRAVTLSTKVETAHPIPSAPVSHFEPGYLFRFQSTEFHAGVAESKCVVVFSDGTYRWEERTENFAGRKRGRAGTGDVDGTALQELKQVLDSSDLKNAADGTAPHVLAQNWQGAVLDVPRDNDVQHVRLDSAFNTHGNPREAGGMSNLGYQVNSQKVLNPLKHWMKQHTSKHDGAVEDMGSNCDPDRAPPKP